MQYFIIIILFSIMLNSCSDSENQSQNQLSSDKIAMIEQISEELTKKYGEPANFRAKRGVEALFSLAKEDTNFNIREYALENFIADETELEKLFNKIELHWETVQGYYNKMYLDLNMPMHVDIGEVNKIDELFAAWSPSAHLMDDMISNEIAYLIALNFPRFTLDEKNKMGFEWTPKQWAMARVGDLFSTKVPAELLQNASSVRSAADNYVSNYYINMGIIRNNENEQLFPDDMKLISHWNLRDELKSHYGKDEKAAEKQDVIYNIMMRIIDQSIPNDVVNSKDYTWNPINNTTQKDGANVELIAEPNTRYQKIIDIFKAYSAIDEYSMNKANYIQRKFEQEMEMTYDEIDKLFSDYLKSSTFKDVAALVKLRLGRDLKPFDIWYDGFKARSSMDENALNLMTRTRYKTPQDLKNDLPNILRKFGFVPERADFIASMVEVDPSRGAGHAWGAEKKGIAARLRTRIAKEGMDYKGYNIAIHEFGHNVEQTISLHNTPYYFINGVPNTAFTEAMAFIFQQRDLDFLGLAGKDEMRKHLYALDNFWATCEIMGVALTDMRVWKWLYDNPNANAEELKNATIKIAKEVWNEFYAPAFGVEDSPILAIYSHTISYPLYLSAYPLGHLIEFQIENYIDGKNQAMEIDRICQIGRLTPKEWMRRAVGSELSGEPLAKAAREALEKVK